MSNRVAVKLRISPDLVRASRTEPMAWEFDPTILADGMADVIRRELDDKAPVGSTFVSEYVFRHQDDVGYHFTLERLYE